eukprot:784967-Rhodomonas_salina.17
MVYSLVLLRVRNVMPGTDLANAATRYYTRNHSIELKSRVSDLYRGFTMAVKFTSDRLLLNFNSGSIEP